MVKIKPEEIKVLSTYIYNVSGISIDASKAYLLETRFGKLLEEEGCNSYSEFYHKAKSDTRKVLEKKIINAITTNETLFFRDSSPFDLLKHKILPDIIDARSGSSPRPGGANHKIWSSACSTGQEIYSIAIVIKELLATTAAIRYHSWGRICRMQRSPRPVPAPTTNLKSNGDCRERNCNVIFRHPATVGKSRMKSAPWPPSGA